MRRGLDHLEICDFGHLNFEKEMAVALLADLPPCGGDARQGRGG